jgi:polysaccharide export outer membrane protein
VKRLISCLVLTLLGSIFVTAAQSDTSAAKGGPAKTVAKGDYILQPSDLLKVIVFQEDDLNREVRISQECSIQLPLIERIDLTGKTVRQAEDIIRRLYAQDYIKNPNVNLSVLEYAPRRVTVLGAVNSPGVVVFQQEGGLTLLEAIGKANGFNRFAQRKKVTLKRIKPDGQAETQVINCDDLAKGDATELWQLQPDDVIFVPEITL